MRQCLKTTLVTTIHMSGCLCFTEPPFCLRGGLGLGGREVIQREMSSARRGERRKLAEPPAGWASCQVGTHAAAPP